MKKKSLFHISSNERKVIIFLDKFFYEIFFLTIKFSVKETHSLLIYFFLYGIYAQAFEKCGYSTHMVILLSGRGVNNIAMTDCLLAYRWIGGILDAL